MTMSARFRRDMHISIPYNVYAGFMRGETVEVHVNAAYHPQVGEECAATAGKSPDSIARIVAVGRTDERKTQVRIVKVP